MAQAPESKNQNEPSGAIAKFLDLIERLGNKLPDPAILFAILMAVVWVMSWLLSNVEFTAINPRDGEPIKVINLLAGSQLADFMSRMVKTLIPESRIT